MTTECWGAAGRGDVAGVCVGVMAVTMGHWGRSVVALR